jgi:tRNA-2-methylthio-N6-dimethylallyladenosine synthase
VDLVFGTHNIHEFPRLLGNVLGERQKIVEVWDEAESPIEGLPTKRKHPNKAYVNIMNVCDNFFTYCIVPYTRGRERSRDPESIIDEIKKLAAGGVSEVTLLGQNVNSYRGQSLPGEYSNYQGGVKDFSQLIHMINEIEDLKRIRFMTSHPKDLSRDLIDAYGICQKLCQHIHLPVQSGSTRILERMDRRYTKEEYLKLIEALRCKNPEIAITTDIIVGFPGETEEDFAETLDLVKRVEFDSAFTFLYSIRKGTPAENYQEQVPEEIKHERFNRLVDAINIISAEKNKAMVGKKLKVLVEGKSKTREELFTGRTEGNKLVNFTSSKDVAGQIADVLITDSTTFSLTGRIE